MEFVVRSLRGLAVGLAISALALALALTVATAPGAAQTVQRIAVVVNDEVISAYDLQQRLRLVISSSGVQASQEMVDRIRPQVLRSLVDERLQIQEAERQSITVDNVEVDRALAAIAQQNNMSATEIEKFLAEGDIAVSTLRSQIEAELAWTKLISQRFGPRIYVSQDDVEAEYGQMMEAMSQPQFLVAEIYLAVDGPDQDEEMRRTAQRLIEELQGGASFTAIAQQFSQSATAAQGGDLGWIQLGQLDPRLDTMLTQMAPGQVSSPIRTAGGYHVLFLRNRRESGGEVRAEPIRVHLKQLVVQVPQDAADDVVEAAASRARGLGTQVKGCGNVEQLAVNATGVASADLGNLPIEQIAPFIRNAISILGVGQPSEPIRGPSGIHILVVCSREMGEAVKVSLPSKEEIEDRLINQQLSMMARRYIRDLRRDAVVEYR